MVQTMTIEELLSLKDYGRNIGYLVNDSFNNKFCFTLSNTPLKFLKQVITMFTQL